MTASDDDDPRFRAARLVLALRQVQKLLCHGLRRLAFGPSLPKPKQPLQYGKALRGLPDMLTQRGSPGEDGFLRG